VFFAGIVLFFFLSQYWQLVQGRTPFKAGLMALPNAAAIITGSAVAQSLLAKVGPRRLVSTAMIIMGTGVALFTTVDIGTSTLRMVGTLMVVGFGFGLAAQPLTDTVMAAVPVEDAGVGSAVNDVSRELGSALGVDLDYAGVFAIQRDAAAAIPAFAALAQPPAPEPEPQPVAQPRRSWFARLLRRHEPKPSASDADRAGGAEDARAPVARPGGAHPEATGPARSSAGPGPGPQRDPEPEPTPEPEVQRDPLEAVLTSALDSLGQAHHRPFSRG